MRKIISSLLALVILFSCIIPASAATKEEAGLFWNKILNIYASISVNQSTGIVTCSGTITAKSTYPVKVYAQLQRLENGSWRTITSWTNTGTLSATVTKSYAVYSGYTYRIYVIGYVYDNNGNIVESGSEYHSVYYPSN